MAGGTVGPADVVTLSALAILAADDLHGSIPRGIVILIIATAISQQLVIICWRRRVRSIREEVRKLSETVSQISKWRWN